MTNSTLPLSSTIDNFSTSAATVTDRLSNSFNVINQRFFQGKIVATIVWQIPNGLVSINKGTPCYTIDNPAEQSDFELAKKAIENGQINKALTLLTPIADKGHPDSELLVCHMLKNQQGQWEGYAKAYNDHFTTEMMAPAACYYPETKTIAIHPHLLHREAPMFVLRYLIFHECCHQIIESSESEPHPPEFMKYEVSAPFRDKALAWLEKEDFPTLAREPSDSL